MAHAEIGRVKIDVGRSDEAIDHIRTAIRLSPTDPIIHAWYFWAGMAAVHLADNGAALEWLLKARQANPNFEHTLQLLAVTYQRIGEKRRARSMMSDYLAKRPRFSISAWRESMRTANPVATWQRQAIADVFRSLGAPEQRRNIARR